MTQSDTELLLQIANASSLQTLCDFGCVLLENPVFIDDMNRNILAYSHAEIDDPLWRQNIVENIHDETLNARIKSKKMYKESISSGHPVLLTDLPTVDRYAMTLTNYGVPIGNVTLASHLRPFREGDRELFELFCHYAVDHLANSRFSFRYSQPVAINTLLRLLEGYPMNRTAVESKLDFLVKSPDTYTHLVVFSDQTGDALSSTQTPVIEQLSSIKHTIVFNYQHYIVALINFQDSCDENKLDCLLSILLNNDLYAGVSKRIHDIMHLPMYYMQAVNAIKMNMLTPEKRIYNYNDIAVFDLFNTISDKVNLMDYCEEQLLALCEYDSEHETNLIHTLQLFLESGLQYETTAKKLYVHKNTVRYRINKCQEWLKTDFTDGNKNFQYVFSLKILKFYKYY